ncbi:DUF4893 domain-containing protein [Roseomonas populi]|uniref:DUF4893 domain-containing protein n=1 Tax=Roseomonas populi TaxID=3121582 RepID=A0ABT1X225_9PROT|nr:DUF4893 domain-containing protein [Roseomonas pecuniae]MCR0982145.1 DUF4893 domain-containing protein [Roseomonas pecuniae]
MAPTRIVLTAGLLLASAFSAMADGFFPESLAKADRLALSGFPARRQAAIEEARRLGQPADVAAMDRALEGDAARLRPAELAGDWRCRSVQLGGSLGVVSYSEFRCRITDDAAGLRLRKLSGSQRTNGAFYDIGEARLGYAGALTYNDDPILRYGQNPERNQIGYLAPVSPRHLRLELPAAGGREGFEIIDFRR